MIKIGAKILVSNELMRAFILEAQLRDASYSSLGSISEPSGTSFLVTSSFLRMGLRIEPTPKIVMKA